LKGLYNRHRETCASIDCFRRQTVIYHAKKRHQIANDNIMMTPGVFAKYYEKDFLEKILSKKNLRPEVHDLIQRAHV
jgi:hypothetical protein